MKPLPYRVIASVAYYWASHDVVEPRLHSYTEECIAEATHRAKHEWRKPGINGLMRRFILTAWRADRLAVLAISHELRERDRK